MKTGLRIHIAAVGFEIKRVTDPIVEQRADKVYLITHSKDDKAEAYIQKILGILKSEKHLAILKRTTNIWDLFECLDVYKNIMKEEERLQSSSHIYVNVSTGSKVSSIAGTLACMIWKGTPYYAHVDYTYNKDPIDGLPLENIIDIAELPVYSINKPKPETLLILEILKNTNHGRIKKSTLIDRLEEKGVINKNLSSAAKHSKIKGLLNPISIVGLSDNPLVEVEYKGRQSNVMLTQQGRSTLKIFGD
jgi:hypothetical protein